ncbi:MAG: ATP-binding protein [Ruminococcus sp.]|jgi:hypothetical protein|nr:ATP-binding protein [Ruminococcus sp.]
MIPKRIANALINSLKGGVVPRVGLEYIQVGRKTEIEALLRDVEIIEDGGSTFRFVVGKYGSGKSFLLQTMHNFVMERGFAVIDADLSPERRFAGTKGQGLATYRELIRNMSVKTKPDGGALSLVLEKWLSGIMTETAAAGLEPGTAAFEDDVRKRIYKVTGEIEGLVNGFEFASVLLCYYDGYKNDIEEKKSCALRWFRGEYGTKTEAKREIGVNYIITDESWYESLKIFSFFLVRAGYKGLFIMIDELAYLYNLHNRTTRQNNYEKILAMYNDCLGGKARYMGVIMGAVPQCIDDTDKGIFSYGALRSRLSEGKFSADGVRDLSAPIIRLRPLTVDEMFVLTEKLAEIHAELFGYDYDIQNDEITAFLKAEYERVGAAEQITPREIIRDFIEILGIMSASPDKRIGDILTDSGFSFSEISGEEYGEDTDEFADFEV